MNIMMMIIIIMMISATMVLLKNVKVDNHINNNDRDNDENHMILKTIV